MAGLIDELIDTLEKENNEYQELIKLSMKKTDIIIKGDIEALQDIVALEQEVVDRIMPLEKKRIEFTNDIGDVINRPPESLTITKLIELMKGQPEVQKRLSKVHSKLKMTMDKMVRLNEMNKGLLKEALELVNFDITLINSMRQAPLTANYDKSAYNTDEHLPNRGRFDTKQ